MPFALPRESDQVYLRCGITNVAIGIRKGSCGTSEYEEEVESIAIVDTLRSLALCQTRAVQEASNAMVLVTDQAASESDRIRSAVNVADADTGAAKGSSSSTTIQLQFHCTFIFLYQCSYY